MKKRDQFVIERDEYEVRSYIPRPSLEESEEYQKVIRK